MNTYFPRMHVSLYCSDIQKTIDFYSGFFGQQPAKTKADYCKFILEKPSLIISFVANKDRATGQFGHLGFQVETKAMLMERLAIANTQSIDVLEEMETNCCYANQDKFWVTDPDGVMWEVYVFNEDVEWNDPRYSSQESSACCASTGQTLEQPEKKKVSLASLGKQSCDPSSNCC